MPYFFKRWRRQGLIVGACILLVIGVYYLTTAPANFSPSLITIAPGATIREAARELAAAHLVRYPLLFETLLRAEGKGVQAGPYKFDLPENVFTVARRLAAGDSGLPAARLTFIEGVTVEDMAKQVAEALPISAGAFSTAALRYQGFLFPDTYFFPYASTPATIVQAMRTNFNAKIEPLAADVAASGHPLADTIVMASLVEKEARTPEDKRIVAGILWHRFVIGMPLQVDAVRETYAHTGLPPAPIANPGLDTIKAVLHPTKTSYLYYLTDKNGVMHYATTFAAHQANQRKYLN